MPTLEPMDPQQPDRRRAVYLARIPSRTWRTRLVEAAQLAIISSLCIVALYAAAVWFD